MKTYLNIGMAILLLSLGGSCRKPVVGCTDPDYGNYRPENNEDDGCCCTVVNGAGHDAEVTFVNTRPFAAIPGSITDTPSVYLKATLRRVDQLAVGPCGCLLGSYSELYPGWYNPVDGVYGPRTRCNTYIETRNSLLSENSIAS